jgi:ppGpp synthetase/RelA/SpoT-type nucleotidyltranferase
VATKINAKKVKPASAKIKPVSNTGKRSSDSVGRKGKLSPAIGTGWQQKDPEVIVSPDNDVIDNWREDYRDYRPMYIEYTWKMRQLVEDLLKNVDIDPAQIEHRTKSMESFIEKLRREGKKYSNPVTDMTDLTALRIIAYDKEEVDLIAELIESEFDIDFVNSVDKLNSLDQDRFGYLSIHYIVSISDLRGQLPEWKAFVPLKAEIQIRTVLQHAWAAIDHRFRYKTETEIPTHLRRKLFRLSALLELADDEFLTLKRLKEQASRDYASQVAAGSFDIELNLTSLEAYFYHTKEHEKWAKISKSLGYKTYSPPKQLYSEVQEISRRRLLQILGRLGVTTVEEIDDILKKVLPEGREYLESVYLRAVETGLTPLAIPYVVIGILILFGVKDRISRSRLRKIIAKSPLLKPIEEAMYGPARVIGKKI